MNLINTPQLSNNDVNYFKYKSYNLNNLQANILQM